MERLFGIPLPAIAVTLTGLTATLAVLVLLLAARHPILVKLGLRQIPRRRARSLLIVIGLALSTTIIAASLLTGDTLGLTVRSLVSGSLGAVDEVVVYYRRGTRPEIDWRALADGRVPTLAGDDFPQAEADRIAGILSDTPGVAGSMGVLTRQHTVADPDRQTISGALTILAVPAEPPAGLGRLTTNSGRPATLGELAEGEVYLNEAAATILDARAADLLTIYPARGEISARVREVVKNGGLGGTRPTIVALLPWWQTVEGSSGSINHVVIVNEGGAESALWSESITRRLRLSLVDDDAAQRLFAILAVPSARDALRASLTQQSPFVRPRLERFVAELERPAASEEFKQLVGDPQVVAGLRPALFGLEAGVRRQVQTALGNVNRLTVVELKQLSLDVASRFASGLTSVFLVLGVLSIATGLILICLIFALLAAERRGELALARALGTQRGQLVQIFLFEGALYDVLASLLGVLIGIGVSVGAAELLSRYVQDYGIHVEQAVEPRSLLIAFCLGLLLTLATVTLAAWRIARLNVVAALRDLPEEPRRAEAKAGSDRLVRRLIRLPRGPILVGAGMGLALGAGASPAWRVAATIGWSAAIVGVGLTLRWALTRRQSVGALADRIGLTVAGLGLLIYWVQPTLPGRATELERLTASLELLAVGSVLSVIGAALALTHNLEALPALVTGGFRRLGGGGRAAATLRLATAYAARHRWRTGLTILMFALVLCTLSMASVLVAGTRHAYADLDAQSGGFEVRAYVDPGRLPDLRSALSSAPAIGREAFTAMGGQVDVAVEAIQLSAPVSRWERTSAQVVDVGWLGSVTAPLTHRASGYASDAAVWAAVRNTPGLAVLHGSAVASSDAARPSANPLGLVSLRLEGLVREDRGLSPTTLWLRDPKGGPPLRVTVIGVLDGRLSLGEGVYTTPATLEGGGWTVPTPRAYYFKVAPGLTARQAVLGLNKSFGDQGLVATVLAEELRAVQGVRLVLNQILQGFLGLGLLSGIVALGVIATRAVVERRHQIGVLRAIGFGRGLIQAAFLLESTVVAGLGIGLGTGLGILLARNVIRLIAAERPEIQFGVPWGQIALIALLTYLASMLATFLPAWQASKVSPAEALRYE
ncbi:MAG: ABC transporter permease [Chloroflexi bacterium]|nr:ABC transporter permease [Chloroflexota bacterium]